MNSDRAEQVAELVDQHGRMIFATVYRILGNAEDAKDATQEFFLKLLKIGDGRLNSKPVQDWGAYLRVAASRSAVDHLRRGRKRQESSLESIDDLEAPDCQNPRRVAMQKQQAALLRNALRSLPKREARVFTLRYFEDFSYEQIAQQMKVSVDLVGVLLHRARGRLQKKLEPYRSPNEFPAGAQSGMPLSGKENSHVAE